MHLPVDLNIKPFFLLCETTITLILRAASSTCDVQHEIFDEVTNNGVRHSNDDQGGHEEVQDRFGELDEVPGWRLVLLVHRLHIL